MKYNISHIVKLNNSTNLPIMHMLVYTYIIRKS